MQNYRKLAWGVLVVVAVIGGLWFFQRSRALRQQNAERAYYQARRAAAAGNLPLAVSDLRKVATRYEGTRGGTQATIFLAQALFDQKQYKEGLAELAKLGADGEADPAVYSLAAAGHEELKDFDAAAAAYKKAADATEFEADKDRYMALAARAYMAAGKRAEAEAIWKALAADETGTMAAEARVRLGELSAKPMTT